jgi:cell division protein FtsB
MAKRPPRKRRRRRGRPPVARWLAVATLAVVALLYYRPLESYFEKRAALERRVEEVRALRAERNALARRVLESDTPEALARRARRIGLIRPDERLFIVNGIEEFRRKHGTRIGGDG